MTRTLRQRIKRGIEFAKANNMSVQQIILRPDTVVEMAGPVSGKVPATFADTEIVVTTRLDAPEWELRLWDEWVDHNGELRLYLNANDLPENLQQQQEQAHLEAHPLYGIF